MHLLYFLAVKLIEHAVILLFVTFHAILDPVDFHSIVENQKASFKF